MTEVRATVLAQHNRHSSISSRRTGPISVSPWTAVGHHLPMPDERDWFQVVADQECEECVLEARAVAQGALGTAISEEGHRWGALLTEHYEIELLRRRPGADVWSAMEYAAHVRDVLALFRDRVVLALSEHEPEFGWWDHEAAAVDERYNEQDPGEVAAALRTNAAGLVRALPSPGDTAWARAGTRRGRERFTVEGLARFALHEARHHRLDAERGCGCSLSGPRA